MPRTDTLRQQIAAILDSKHLLSVPQLVAELNQHPDNDYHRSSVYKALERMVDDGLICKLTFDKGEHQYELRDHHHDHLQCNNCGKVWSVECQVSHPTQIEGFEVDHHHVTYLGVCSGCKD